MPARFRPPRRALLVVIAACAVLGIGAVATTAAWTAQASFTAKTTAAAFNMEYSFTAGEKDWHAFPSATWELTQVRSVFHPGESDEKQHHVIFIRNKSSGAKTTVTFTPEIEGVFLEDPDFLIISTGINVPNPALLRWHPGDGSVDVLINEHNEARIDLVFDPAKLNASDADRVGTFKLTVTGTVGDVPEEPTGAPAHADTTDRFIAAPVDVAPRRSDWT